MDIVAHGLWAGAVGIAGKKAGLRIRVAWLAWWAMFPDVLAFGPAVAVGLWMALSGRGDHPHVHMGLPLYAIGHSLVVFTVVFGVATLALRRPPLALLGWLTHILIDIPTHSFQYYATRFLWPISDYAFNGVAWWTPWLLACTYGGLALVYLLLWRMGWLTRERQSPAPTETK